MEQRDWLGIGIRFSCGALLGAFVGLVLSMFQMGMNAGWLIIVVPAVIGGVAAVRYEG
jgi:hypothetical protein